MRRRANSCAGGGRRGFTLLELLVAVTIMAIAVGTLLSALTTSVRNASRLTESDRAAILAKRTMNHLLLDPNIPVGRPIGGQFDRRETGIEAGWQARLDPFLAMRGLPGNLAGTDRLVVEVWWMQGSTRRTVALESYRAAPKRLGP